jgi:pumilio family protein 6
VHDALVAAIAQYGSDGQAAAAAADGEGGGEEAQEPVLTHFFGSRALRRLLLASGADDASGRLAAAFAGKLWLRVLKGRCKELVGTHAAKVLAALLQCGAADVKKQAAKELQAAVPGSLDEWAAGLTQKGDGSGGGKNLPKSSRKSKAGAQQSNGPSSSKRSKKA